MRFKVVLTNFIVILVILGNFCLAKTKYDEKPNTLKNQSKESMVKKEFFKGDWILREDIHVFSEPVNRSVQANIYQNKDRLRLAFFISPDSDTHVKNVDLNLNFNPMYFFVMGKPVLYDTQIRERNNIDYKFKNELVVFRVKVSRYIKYIEFNVASRKLKNIGKLTIKDKIKQARTIRRIKQQLDSWSQLANGQIIAQETLRPIISHGGYAVDGIKRAVIWANYSKLTGKFELIDALNNVQHPDVQPVVFTGDLKESGNHVWGGNNYIADFSDLKKEGLYFVRLKVNETNKISDSYVFPIKKDIYLELAKKASKWFYYQRCGTEVPGFHKACHMQDTIIKKDGTKVDVSGGWHDAGDYGKWIGGGTSGVLALTIFQDQFRNEFKSSEVPELTDEAAWEARYFCKGYWDGAFHPGFTGNFENVCEWLGAPECEPPRIVLEEEMIENNYGPVKSPGISLTGASLAIVARQIKPYDKEFAKKCITIAKDAYNIDSKVELEKNKFNSFLGLQTGLLLSDVELYKITKDKKYKKDAKIRVKNITKQQIDGKEGFFYYDEAKKSETHADCRFQMLALYEYYKAFPESKLNKEIKNTFKRWADYMMKYADVSSFGLIGGVTKDGTIKSYRYVAGANRRIGAVAWGLATAAIILDEPKYLEAAELQLQWIIGFNPADISMMASVGKGPGCYHHRYSFMKGCEHGIVPGGILNGIMPGNGEIIEIGDITKNFIIAKLPPEYPIIDTGVWGWTFAYLTNEYWTRNNSWFVLGAMQIVKAMRELK